MKNLKKFVSVFVLVAILLAAVAPVTVAQASGPGECGVVKDVDGNAVSLIPSGFKTHVTVEARAAWDVPDGLTADYRQDALGVDFHFQAKQRVPAGRATLKGCYMPTGNDQNAPADATKTVCAAIDGATMEPAKDQFGKLEPGATWIHATKSWKVPKGMVADVWGGSRYGENQPAGDVAPVGDATLFGCVMSVTAAMPGNTGLTQAQSQDITMILAELKKWLPGIRDVVCKNDPTYAGCDPQ